MKFYIGNDVESIARFKRIWDSKSNVLGKLFFENELKIAGDSSHPHQTLAGIWCAKEATAKAFGSLMKFSLHDVEIYKNTHGGPVGKILCNKANLLNYQLTLSVSHTKDIAMATALLVIAE